MRLRAPQRLSVEFLLQRTPIFSPTRCPSVAQNEMRQLVIDEVRVTGIAKVFRERLLRTAARNALVDVAPGISRIVAVRNLTHRAVLVAVHDFSSPLSLLAGKSDGKRPSAIDWRPAARMTPVTKASTSAFAAVVMRDVASWNCLTTNGTFEAS